MTKEPAEPADIAVDYEKDLTVQQYGGGESIDGVKLVGLTRHVDDGGSFQELARLTEDGRLEAFPGFQVRQINHSVMQPGAIKAFHLHRTQEDVWFIPPESRMLVGLVDCREHSATKDNTMRFVMGDGRSQLLHIPRGVAHGVKNLAREPGVIIYLVNQQFDPDDPDEGRLSWSLEGEGFWEITHG